MRTAFVTGGTGFVGHNLVAELIAQGWQVVALHRASADIGDLVRLGADCVEGDLLDAARLRAVMPEGADAVFHVAGDTNMWSRRNRHQTRINVEGTRNVLDAAAARGAARFIHTSTVSAYGLHEQPISEATPSIAARSWINYERSKWLAEVEVHKAVASGLDAVIINPCAIVGPHDTRSWARLFFQVRDGKIKALPPGAAPFNHVREVVRAHIAAVDAGRTGENYLLPGEEVSFADMIREIARLLGLELTARVAPAPMLKTVARLGSALSWLTNREPDITPEMAALMCSSVSCQTDKAERELGYRKVPLRIGLKDCYDWLVANGYLEKT